MSAEPQVYLKADYSYPIGYARPGDTAELAEKTKASVLSMGNLLEHFWSFYEAMRSGKPLPNADEKLSHIGTVVRTVMKRS